MWWCNHGGYMGWWWWGPLWSLLWFALLGLLVYWIVRSLASGASGRDRALEVLRERYARGEIDKETFERMKRDLS